MLHPPRPSILQLNPFHFRCYNITSPMALRARAIAVRKPKIAAATRRGLSGRGPLTVRQHFLEVVPSLSWWPRRRVSAGHDVRLLLHRPRGLIRTQKWSERRGNSHPRWPHCLLGPDPFGDRLVRTNRLDHRHRGMGHSKEGTRSRGIASTWPRSRNQCIHRCHRRHHRYLRFPHWRGR